MRQSLLVSTVIAGLCSLAGLSSSARAESLEEAAGHVAQQKVIIAQKTLDPVVWDNTHFLSVTAHEAHDLSTDEQAHASADRADQICHFIGFDKAYKYELQTVYQKEIVDWDHEDTIELATIDPNTHQPARTTMDTSVGWGPFPDPASVFSSILCVKYGIAPPPAPPAPPAPKPLPVAPKVAAPSVETVAVSPNVFLKALDAPAPREEDGPKAAKNRGLSGKQDPALASQAAATSHATGARN